LLDASKTITVKVCGDAGFEFDETFLVNLSNATSATLVDGQALGTISNDDAAPTVSISHVILGEGDSGTTDFTFSVTKTGETEVTATVEFATADGTTLPATGGVSCGPGVDYETQSGSLSFAPADGSETITVKVCGEAVYERDQTFFVNLSNPSAATIADGQGPGTIINDDSAPVLNIGNVSAAEGNSGTTDFTFSVTKSGQTEVDASVDFATAPGTTNPATAGEHARRAWTTSPRPAR
jgi:heat shock protein HslJ